MEAITLIIFLIIIAVFLGFGAYVAASHTQENREYQDALDDLYKQLQTGKITLQRYHELRTEIERRYHKTQRDRDGF